MNTVYAIIQLLPLGYVVKYHDGENAAVQMVETIVRPVDRRIALIHVRDMLMDGKFPTLVSVKRAS